MADQGFAFGESIVVTSINRRQFVYAAAASVFVAALPGLAFAAEQSALDFARSLYSLKNYWSDITADEITTGLYLDANLAALIKENYAKDDFDSALDYDPLVQAQDWDEVVTHFKVVSEDAKTAVVSVAIDNVDEHTTVTLHLTKTANGWRLSDIIAVDDSSLVAELKQLNAKPPSND